MRTNYDEVIKLITVCVWDDYMKGKFYSKKNFMKAMMVGMDMLKNKILEDNVGMTKLNGEER